MPSERQLVRRIPWGATSGAQEGDACGMLADGQEVSHKPLSFLERSGFRQVVKLTLRDKETAQEAVRRFRKLVERSGIKKEIRIREFYEKPSETKRRARLRAQRRARRERVVA